MNSFRLGIFIVAGLAILCAGIFFIGNRNLDFRSTYALKAEFANAGGLEAGADVRVGGIHMGTVHSIELPKSPEGKVSVVMDLADQTKGVVKQDSVASIQAEGLVGDEYVEVSFGSKGAAAIHDGDTIAGRPPLQMSQLFDKTNGILDQVQVMAQSLEGASKNMEDISGKINNGTGTVGALINNKSLYKEANAGVEAFQDDAEALKHNFLLRGFFKKRGYEDAAELTKNEIHALPTESPSREFTYNAKGLFDKPDTAELKDGKELKPAGQFLQSSPFSLAVVAALGKPKGDSIAEQKLTLARAAVVRDYLVTNFKLPDARLKTIGLPKQADQPDGQVQIKVYPAPATASRH
ncbi:MAG TPA: MlaD family protein [Bryobacteraceae bacterium]|jgi:phospholipid/cholesterol/gamma-HCH transport system substrate-binding protein|nr:MlaD family protein [Bryobacteraceae bacterium]